MENLAFNLALMIFLFLPLYRIQFLKIIKADTKINTIQNLDLDIVVIFIWLAKAKKNAPNTKYIEISNKLMYNKATRFVRLPKRAL